MSEDLVGSLLRSGDYLGDDNLGDPDESKDFRVQVVSSLSVLNSKVDKLTSMVERMLRVQGSLSESLHTLMQGRLSYNVEDAPSMKSARTKMFIPVVMVSTLFSVCNAASHEPVETHEYLISLFEAIFKNDKNTGNDYSSWGEHLCHYTIGTEGSISDVRAILIPWSGLSTIMLNNKAIENEVRALMVSLQTCHAPFFSDETLSVIMRFKGFQDGDIKMDHRSLPVGVNRVRLYPRYNTGTPGMKKYLMSCKWRNNMKGYAHSLKMISKGMLNKSGQVMNAREISKASPLVFLRRDLVEGDKKGGNVRDEEEDPVSSFFTTSPPSSPEPQHNTPSATPGRANTTGRKGKGRKKDIDMSSVWSDTGGF